MSEWRSYEEEQLKLQEEQSAIELKQKLHLEEYRKERAGLTHLSWKQRKWALYRANKSKFAMRPSERVASKEHRLPLIIKGTRAHAHTLFRVHQSDDSIHTLEHSLGHAH